MQELAVIRMIILGNGSPGVQLRSEQAFMDLKPIDRATLLNAALHLCVAAINAIADDHPEEADEIMDRLEEMSIDAVQRTMN